MLGAWSVWLRRSLLHSGSEQFRSAIDQSFDEFYKYRLDEKHIWNKFQELVLSYYGLSNLKFCNRILSRFSTNVVELMVQTIIDKVQQYHGRVLGSPVVIWNQTRLRSRYERTKLGVWYSYQEYYVAICCIVLSDY